MHSICVWNMIEQSKPLQTRYDTTYISDRYFIRLHVYGFLFSVKKCVFELSRVWPWRWPCGGTQYMVYIGPVFHNTIKTCLKTVGYCGYEWVEKECVGLQRTWVSKPTVFWLAPIFSQSLQYNVIWSETQAQLPLSAQPVFLLTLWARGLLHFESILECTFFGL